jgi:PAS domain S-box-containing protein
MPALHKDGREFPVELTIWKSGSSSATTFNAFLHDISERKGVEERMSQLAAIVESTDDAIISKTLTGTILSWNKGAQMIYGYSAQETIGKPISMLVPSDRLDELPYFFENLLIGKHIEQFETLRIRKDGVLIHVSLTISPVKNSKGKIVGACTIARDITERKKAEETLLKRQQELARSNAEREQLELFASVAGHDLQEPLQKIVAFGDLLKMECETAINAEGKDYLDRMKNAAKRMSELISDLLKFSKVTTKKEPPERVVLKEIVEEVVSDLEWRLQESGAHVELKELPTVSANRVHLREVFQNLITNAIKFRKKDEPLVITVDSDVNDGSVEISVKDNGIGFDEKFSERIFRPFERLHRRGEYAGSGIGLAICQRIVAHHGGRIFARSKPGDGATFVVSFPKDMLVEGGVSLAGKSSH